MNVNNTCVIARGVLDPAKVSLSSDAHGVVSVGQLETGSVVVVETHHHPAHPGEILETTVGS